ncbi:MAG: ornithine cyclodeaminase [Proteobacteria bacterium]|nr:ornithine cyclodeaminase [Pseudomonadota bacterium]
MKIKVFRAEDISQALSMIEAIEVVKSAFVQLSSKQAQAPVRTSLNLKNQGEVALTMPAFLGATLALGTKIVTVFPQNPSQGLSAVQALVVLFDAVTGGPSAILEGTHLTRLRTGAATGAATQIFSRQDAKSLALFGAGGQAFFQVQGVWAVRKVARTVIFDLLPERVDSLISLLQKTPRGQEVEILKARSPEEALDEADIVVTATSSRQPVFPGKVLRLGAHINAIGAFQAEMQEVDEETILRSRIFVDSVAACLEEAGDLIIPLKKGLIRHADIQAELGEVIAGRKSGRRDNQEITYFKSVGNAVQDISVAQAVFQRASAKGLGQEVGL